MEQAIYLIAQFRFPVPFKPEYGEKAKALHSALQGKDWISEVFSASGGLGGGPPAIWVLRLSSYAGLDRLLRGEDPVSAAYLDFFGSMDEVTDMLREEVLFLDDGTPGE